MNYNDILREATKRTGSIICTGFDPLLERIPLKGDPEEVITKYCIDILDAFEEHNCLPGAFKPNIAYYEQYGLPGLRALEKIVARCKELEIPLILDAKRADIDRTSTAYANAAFEWIGADALTVAPYMGSDSVTPFVREGKGAYILVRTSNKGARDLQDLEVDGTPIFVMTAKKVIEWAKPGTGAVVGATYPAELKLLANLFIASGKEIPLLIPGVGAQGASASSTAQLLRDAGYDLNICRINSSSGIMFAHEKEGTDDYKGAAVRALKKLNDEVGTVL